MALERWHHLAQHCTERLHPTTCSFSLFLILFFCCKKTNTQIQQYWQKEPKRRKAKVLSNLPKNTPVSIVLSRKWGAYRCLCLEKVWESFVLRWDGAELLTCRTQWLHCLWQLMTRICNLLWTWRVNQVLMAQLRDGQFQSSVGLIDATFLPQLTHLTPIIPGIDSIWIKRSVAYSSSYSSLYIWEW